MTNNNSDLSYLNNHGSSLTSTENFEGYLRELGLPHENIIAPSQERNLMQINLPTAIQGLSEKSKSDAVYLSKFVASSAIGLYDAALNYLWNEVVLSLRGKVISYGLDLFYDAAVGGDLRETYSTVDDLPSIKDNTLIDTCRKLELITDILHQKLRHILFMRNNIGASHPTQESIRTYELLGWLETCVKDVIDDKPSNAAFYVQQLIVNLKNDDLIISTPHLEQISSELQKQNTRIAGNLLITLFGIFTKKNTSTNIRSNILLLAPVVWNASPDSKRFEVGHKLDQYGLNLDQESLSLATRFLEKCDGLNYKSEGTRSREIKSLLDRLLDTHYARDNFHHEVPIVRQIKQYIIHEDDILPSIEDQLIKVILICRIGNGIWYRNGVSPDGKPVYDQILQLLNSNQVNKLIKFMSEPEILNQFSEENCIDQAKQLLSLFNRDLQEPRTQEAIDFISNNLFTYRTRIFSSKELKGWIEIL